MRNYIKSSLTLISLFLGSSNFGVAIGAQQSQVKPVIPDDKAYHMVFLVASVNSGATKIEVNRANAVADNIGLGENDRSRFADLVSQYRASLHNMDGSKPTSGELEGLYIRKQNLLGETILQAQTQLTAAGAEKLLAYVNREKAHMNLFDLPEMPEHDTGVVGTLKSLFALPTVHAQGMRPQGTEYTNLSADNVGNLYATGTTDATSSCNCHTSYVSTTVTSFDGRSTSSGNSGVEVAQATTELTFDDTLNQFGNGRIQAQSTHSAYCPIINFYFLQNVQSLSQATSAYIKAYYACRLSSGHCAVNFGLATYLRCNPKSLCNTLITKNQVNGNFPAFVLLNVLAIEDFGCNGGKKIVVADKCSPKDPIPGP